MNKKIWLTLLIQFFLATFSQAKGVDVVAPEIVKHSENKWPQIPQVQLLPINKNLHSLLVQLKQSSVNIRGIENDLANFTLSKLPLNAAEQYLLLIIKALLKENKTDLKTDKAKASDVIELLKETDKLAEQISEQQLCQPDFLQLHLILAENYAIQGQYDLAYLEKKHYLKKHYIYRKNKRAAMISSLEQSFEVKNKKANNSLLASQNNIKVLKVEEAKKQKVDQQYNFIVIISIAMVFVLLFFRQLVIRNKLIQLTKTDALTGLMNRSALFEHGERMVTSFSEQPTEFSILLLDLDHFRKINDNFGHQVGDHVLIKIAELIKETMRSRDIFSRLGGEQFVALLPFADSNKAKAIAMRINEKIAQYDFSSLMIQSKVSVSIGVATMENNEMSFDDVLHGADLAMYQAKEQGRNTVVCYRDIAITQERRAN